MDPYPYHYTIEFSLFVCSPLHLKVNHISYQMTPNSLFSGRDLLLEQE
jgi:hypothetical protein